MGKYDLVEQVLGELGAEFYFTGAEDSAGKAGCVWKLLRCRAIRVGAAPLLLWIARESGIYHGDFSTLRASHDCGTCWCAAGAADLS